MKAQMSEHLPDVTGSHQREPEVASSYIWEVFFGAAQDLLMLKSMDAAPVDQEGP